MIYCRLINLDVDECKNRNLCGINAKCINSEGGYECECRPGYEKIELTAKSRCRDTNECVFGAFPCGQNTKCINTDGGFKCLCKDGFIGNATTGCKCECFVDTMDKCQSSFGSV